MAVAVEAEEEAEADVVEEVHQEEVEEDREVEQEDQEVEVEDHHPEEGVGILVEEEILEEAVTLKDQTLGILETLGIVE